ncbi:MAG: hypothetical protein M1830_008306 [Pleopsidium flavum]|nr:MAG: hypothetical protein M1830_008306 [Pleopsidium flavum]
MRRTHSSIQYVSDKVCAATQMFDPAHIILILAQPEHSRHEHAARSAAQVGVVKYYVDRVVANSVVNRRDIPWANAVQLLTSAGLAIVGWAERKALIKSLGDIHIQTGWNTQGNSDGLFEWWGWAIPLRDRGQTWRDVHGTFGPPKTAEEYLMRMFDVGTSSHLCKGKGRSK